MSATIAKLLKKSVESMLEDKVGVAFSGGIDSTTLAHIAKKHSEIILFTAGREESEDMRFAEIISKEMALPLEKLILADEEIPKTYKRCEKIMNGNGDFLKLELLVPFYEIGKKANELGIEVMLVGAGSEELFVGYNRYYTYHEEGKDLDAILKEEFRTLKNREMYMIKKVLRHFDVEARFPFYDKKLAEEVFSVPLEERMENRELKKGILRETARLLGVPETAIKRKKRALQYGTGIHKILIKEKRKGNL